ncbi:DUF6456 domain-containing protein [Paenirhodobacter enshiensis]|uniref:DUF6456 domain-containing protein n=1 Tax=Paenirhodobacter enshiensis TaxID=1105367 RepID=UPI003FA2B000
MSITTPTTPGLPGWLPDHARLYIRHVEEGIPIRQLARAEGCHASTILRRVRRIEERRDDPLVDEALSQFGQTFSAQETVSTKDLSMTARRPDPAADTARAVPGTDPADLTAREEQRILRRLAEPGAQLAVAPEMDKAVVMRASVRTAVTQRATAQGLALKDWIQIRHTGRVTTYEITLAGRGALRRMVEAERVARGLDPEEEDDGGLFAAQHRDWGRPAGTEGRGRTNLAESPLGVLARRRDANGQPFLGPELVAAGERLREDFELAQMGPRVAQNWERFLTGGGERGGYRETSLGGGSERARERVAAALRDLGPGLGDMVLRCCCFLEGLESAERRLGWSARSGKIVLRIALIRLKRHYDEVYGGAMPLIG